MYIFRKTTVVSYEEYYITWFKIATSKPAEDFKHPGKLMFCFVFLIKKNRSNFAQNVNKSNRSFI